jgi:hypothetical protein
MSITRPIVIAPPSPTNASSARSIPQLPRDRPASWRSGAYALSCHTLAGPQGSPQALSAHDSCYWLEQETPMPKPFEEWTVLPHGKLTKIDDDVLTVTGTLHMPLGDYPRRMTVVRLSDGRLVIYSAIALDEREMHALESYGTPAFLIVPGDIHRLDAKIWRDRYPNLLVVTPPGAREKVEQAVHVDATDVDFADPFVRFVAVPGTEGHEAALLIERPSGATLVVNDLIWNLDDRPGFGGWIMKVAGFTGTTAHIPPLVDFKLIKDKPALRAQLEAWSRVEGLERIVVSHGDIVTREPRAVLHRLAESLAA